MYTINHDYANDQIVSTHRTVTGALRTIARKYRTFWASRKNHGQHDIFPLSLRDENGEKMPWDSNSNEAKTYLEVGPIIKVRF